LTENGMVDSSPAALQIAFTALIVPSTIACMGYLRQLNRFTRYAHLPWISIALITVTAAVTALQFRFPAILSESRRDLEGLLAGEVWRLVTPLFVQPEGITQALANGFFAVLFLPLAERIYGARVLVIYFAAGVLCQLVVYAWSPDSGGSSSALFGVMGALLGYVLRHRRLARWPFVALASVAFVGATGLTIFFRADGHGPGLLIGALVAACVRAEPFPAEQVERSTASATT
jgi:rhomboid protease GluP